MFDQAQKEFNENIRVIALKNVTKKLKDQGLREEQLSEEQLDELVAIEVEILKSDGKKVGAGIGVGIMLSMLTGGLF